MDKKLEIKIRSNFEEVLSRFNFTKVHCVMNYLGWTWGGENNSPSKKRMLETVNELFESGINEFDGEEISISSGGFRVVIYKSGTVEILFIVTSSYSNE